MRLSVVALIIACCCSSCLGCFSSMLESKSTSNTEQEIAELDALLQEMDSVMAEFDSTTGPTWDSLMAAIDSFPWDSISMVLENFPEPKIASGIPTPDGSWVDHKCDELYPGLVVSTPADLKVLPWEMGVDIYINDDAHMQIQQEHLDMYEEWMWYVQASSREDLTTVHFFDDELIYTCTDLGAPRGYQNSNSFFATKTINGVEFSTNVDGIIVNDASAGDVYQMSMKQIKLLLAVFRTARIEPNS